MQPRRRLFWKSRHLLNIGSRNNSAGDSERLVYAVSQGSVAIVEPGQTLRQICLRHLGRYSLRIVQHIQALNPGLDPNHIEVGQRIRLSPQGQDSTTVERDELKARDARSEGKGI